MRGLGNQDFHAVVDREPALLVISWHHAGV